MAKNMARLEDGTVINVEWVSDETVETDTFVNLGDVPAMIGDTYTDGAFYRDGEKVLTALEQLRAELEDMRNALNTLGVTVDG